jgi:protoporphyrin/coproporphyrin ferrochelatase
MSAAGDYANTCVVLLGFGGPTSPNEVRPFLDRVLKGTRIPPERYEEVVEHYERIGGKSPFNERTQQQADKLREELLRRGIDVPVRVAYRNAKPFIGEVAEDLAHSGMRAIAIILTAQQSEASWDRYYGSIPGALYVAPYYEHPLFVRAHAERVNDALGILGKDVFDDVALIFTAHSIPKAMAQGGPYVAQLQRSAELVAQRSGARKYTIAFQSRSGSPDVPWLEPDVRDVLASLPQAGTRDAVVAPLGFLCDHVEVLYDLDIDAAAVARQHGVRMARALALNDHPLFIRMLADLVAQCGE